MNIYFPFFSCQNIENSLQITHSRTHNAYYWVFIFFRSHCICNLCGCVLFFHVFVCWYFFNSFLFSILYYSLFIVHTEYIDCLYPFSFLLSFSHTIQMYMYRINFIYNIVTFILLFSHIFQHTHDPYIPELNVISFSVHQSEIFLLLLLSCTHFQFSVESAGKKENFFIDGMSTVTGPSAENCHGKRSTPMRLSTTIRHQHK